MFEVQPFGSKPWLTREWPEACAQCGRRWEARRPGYCPECQEPALGAGFDPLEPVRRAGPVGMNRRAKTVLRIGVFGLGLMLAVTAFCLGYAAWFDPAGLEIVHVWACRLASPVLLAQGAAYLLLPFRQPARAKVLPFRGPSRR